MLGPRAQTERRGGQGWGSRPPFIDVAFPDEMDGRMVVFKRRVD
jgi:hypothetical protein